MSEKPTSKTAAIREIVEAKGFSTDTPAKDIVDACTAKYKSIGVSAGDVNQWKMRERKKNGNTMPGKRGRKPGSTNKFPPAHSPAPEGMVDGRLEKLRKTLELIDAAGGVEEAKALIELAGKIS